MGVVIQKRISWGTIKTDGNYVLPGTGLLDDLQRINYLVEFRKCNNGFDFFESLTRCFYPFIVAEKMCQSSPWQWSG